MQPTFAGRSGILPLVAEVVNLDAVSAMFAARVAKSECAVADGSE
jgi:hypothetical protein